MDVNLVIPRHEYGSLRDGRESLSLSPEGKLALDRLATCSRSAAADLTIRVFDAIVSGAGSLGDDTKGQATAEELAAYCERLKLIGQELANVLGGNDVLCWVSSGFAAMSQILDGEIDISEP